MAPLPGTTGHAPAVLAPLSALRVRKGQRLHARLSGASEYHCAVNAKA